MVNQDFNKAFYTFFKILYRARNFIKNGANIGSLCRSPENFNVFTGRTP